MANSFAIGPLEQVPPGEGRNFVVNDETIAVFRTRTGEVYATQAYCPHRQGPLADGLLGGSTIVCPLHERTFDLRSGDGTGPDCLKIRTYPVSLTENRQMLISL